MPFSSEFIAQLALVKNDYPSLTELNLAGKNIGDDGVSLLSEYLQSNKSVTSINLASNNISSVGAAKLAEALQKKPEADSALNASHISKMLKLDIANNNIEDDGVVKLMQVLQRRQDVYELTIGENGCTQTGISAIADFIRNSSSLAILNFIPGSNLSNFTLEDRAELYGKFSAAAKFSTSLIKFNFDKVYVWNAARSYCLLADDFKNEVSKNSKIYQKAGNIFNCHNGHKLGDYPEAEQFFNSETNPENAMLCLAKFYDCLEKYPYSKKKICDDNIILPVRDFIEKGIKATEKTKLMLDETSKQNTEDGEVREASLSKDREFLRREAQRVIDYTKALNLYPKAQVFQPIIIPDSQKQNGR